MTMKRLCLTALFALWCLCAPAAEKSPTIVYINGAKYYVHTVQPGETLYALSKSYNVSEKVILENNPSAADGLKASAVLKIPFVARVSEQLPDRKLRRTFDFHTVERGETLYAISRRYEIPIQTIIEDNPTLDPIHLRLGERILIRRKQIGSEDKAGTQQQWEAYRNSLNSVAEAGTSYHIVHPGETFYSLSRRFGITEEELGRLNGGLKAADLKAGAMIKVPGEASPEPAADLADTLSLPADAGRYIDERVEEIDFRALRSDQPLDVALLLPLAVNGQPNANYLEFYQGFLLGLEELKEQGRGAVNLTLYNTAHDQLKVQQIVGSESFASTDLIVGPVYEDELKPVVDFAEANSVPVVSPLANLSAVESPTLFQLAPAAENKYDKIGNLIDGGRDIYLIYASANDGEFEKEILAELEGKPRYSYTYSYNQRSIFTPRDASSPAISDMADVLKGERPCLFIVLANSETDVDRILGTISSANTSIVERGTKSAQYVVLGTSRWGRFNNIDHTSFFNNNVVMISTYHAKRDSEAVRDFDSRYIETYGMLPSLYSYRGYDAAMIFVAGMRSDIEYRMLDKRYAPLQTEYKFRQTGEGGRYVNQEWMRVNYNSNYTITLE